MTQKRKTEMWRDFVSIIILLIFALVVGFFIFSTFELIGYFALIPSTFGLFMFGWAFHTYLRVREKFFNG